MSLGKSETYALRVGDWTKIFALASWLDESHVSDYAAVERLLDERVQDTFLRRRLLRELDAAADGVVECLLGEVQGTDDVDWSSVLGVLPPYDDSHHYAYRDVSDFAARERAIQLLFDQTVAASAGPLRPGDILVIWTACTAAATMAFALRDPEFAANRLSQDTSIAEAVLRAAKSAARGLTQPARGLPEHRDTRTLYLDCLKQRLRTSDTGRTWFAAGVRTAPLDEWYIARRVRDSETGEVTTDLGALAQQHQRVLVCGEPGAGKTAAFTYLALRLAERNRDPYVQEAATAPAPMLVLLRECIGGLQSLADLKRRVLRPLTTSAVGSWMELQIDEGRVVLLLDGLDEMPNPDRLFTWRWLCQLTSARPELSVVVSTRPSAIEGLELSPFHRVDLEPLDDTEINRLIALRGAVDETAASRPGSGQALLDSLSRRPDLRRLASNPAMCTLLWRLNEKQQPSQVESSSQLYSYLLDQMLHAWRPKPLQSATSLSSAQILLLLARLAYWFQTKGHDEADREDVLPVLRRELAPFTDRAGTDARQVLEALTAPGAILRESVPGRVEFAHHTFQEYLASTILAERKSTELLTDLAQSERWCYPIALASETLSAHQFRRLLTALQHRAAESSAHRSELLLTLRECVELRPGITAEGFTRHETTLVSPQQRTIVALEIERYSSRSSTQQLEIQAILPDVVRRAVATYQMPLWDQCHLFNRGDGMILVAPEAIAEDFTRFIETATDVLEEFNHHTSRENRLRVRVAMTTGLVVGDPDVSLVGHTVITACRLLDSADVRQALRESDAVLAVIVADSPLSSVVAMASRLRLRPVFVVAKDIETVAHVGVFGRQASTNPQQGSQRPSEISSEAPSESRAIPPELRERALAAEPALDGLEALRAPGVAIIATVSQALAIIAPRLIHAGASGLCVSHNERSQDREVTGQTTVPLLFDFPVHDETDVYLARADRADMVTVDAGHSNGASP